MGHGLADAVGHRDRLTSHRHDLNIAPDTRPRPRPPVEDPDPDRSIDCAYVQIADTHPEDQAARIGIGGSGFNRRRVAT